MSVISLKTVYDLKAAYEEIAVAKRLIEEFRRAHEHRDNPDIYGSFGGRRVVQLMTLNEQNSSSPLYISWDLAEPLIEAHIAQMKAKLSALSAAAVSEMAAANQEPSNQGETSVPPSPAIAR